MSNDEALAHVESEIEVAEPEVTALDQTNNTSVDGSLLIGAQFNDKLAERFRQLVAERQTRPRPQPKVRNWEINFGPVAGKAGETLRLVNDVRALFRGERIVATDTASPIGCGTRIVSLTVDGRTQDSVVSIGATSPLALPALILTVFANRKVLMDVGSTFGLTVSFIEACTFNMNIVGKALI